MSAPNPTPDCTQCGCAAYLKHYWKPGVCRECFHPAAAHHTGPSVEAAAASQPAPTPTPPKPPRQDSKVTPDRPRAAPAAHPQAQHVPRSASNASSVDMSASAAPSAASPAVLHSKHNKSRAELEAEELHRLEATEAHRRDAVLAKQHPSQHGRAQSHVKSASSASHTVHDDHHHDEQVKAQEKAAAEAAEAERQRRAAEEEEAERRRRQQAEEDEAEARRREEREREIEEQRQAQAEAEARRRAEEEAAQAEEQRRQHEQQEEEQRRRDAEAAEEERRRETEAAAAQHRDAEDREVEERHRQQEEEERQRREQEEAERQKQAEIEAEDEAQRRAAEEAEAEERRQREAAEAEAETARQRAEDEAAEAARRRAEEEEEAQRRAAEEAEAQQAEAQRLAEEAEAAQRRADEEAAEAEARRRAEEEAAAAAAAEEERRQAEEAEAERRRAEEEAELAARRRAEEEAEEEARRRDSETAELEAKRAYGKESSARHEDESYKDQQAGEVMNGHTEADAPDTVNENDVVSLHAVTLTDVSSGSAKALALVSGADLLITRQDDGGWWTARMVEHGQLGPRGLVPADCVALVVETVRAKFEFRGASEEQLSFAKGDLLRVYDKSDPVWWRGMCGGDNGLFRKDYTETVDSDFFESIGQAEVKPYGAAAEPVAEVISAQHSDHHHEEQSKPHQTEHSGRKAICLYDLPSSGAHQLELKKGDELVVFGDIGSSAAGWVDAEAEGVRGQVPSNYIRVLDDQSYFVSKYPYNALEVDQLTFSAGENLILMGDENGGWVLAKHVPTAAVGLAPLSYLEAREASSSAGLADAAVTGAVVASAGQPSPRYDPVEPASADAAADAEAQPGMDDTTTTDPNTSVDDPNLSSVTLDEADNKDAGASRPATIPEHPIMEGDVVICVFDYKGSRKDEISLKAGKLYKVINKDHSEWWTVKADEGVFKSSGRAPSSCLAPILLRTHAVMEFKATQPEQMSLKKDQKVIVFKRNDNGWWEGYSGDKHGQFPATYVASDIGGGEFDQPKARRSIFARSSSKSVSGKKGGDEL